MSKLEVGMYVRYKYPRYYVPIQISKIKSKEYDEFEKYYSYITDNDLVITEEQIIGEPSFNIMDLIEAGDYVNGGKVLEKKIEWVEFYDVDKLVYLYIVIDGEKKLLYEKDISSIVTKEQFESMEYEVME